MPNHLRTPAVALMVAWWAASCASPTSAPATVTPPVTTEVIAATVPQADTPTQEPRPADPLTATGTGDQLNTPTAPPPSLTLNPHATLILLNPCSLVTQGEAVSALGEPVSRPIRAGGGCVYVDTASQRHVLTAFAVMAPEAADTIQGHLILLGTFGYQFTPAQAAELQALGAAGDVKGVVENMIVMTEKSTFQAEKLDGLGDTAMWASKELGIVRQGFVLVARAQTLVGVDLVITSARDDLSLRDTGRALAEKMLDRLPELFTVALARPSATPAIGVTIIPATVLTTTGTRTLFPATTPAPATTTPVPQTPIPTPDVEPPAFSQPVLSGSQIVYGGSCGTKLITMSVKVIDPAIVYGIQTASVVLRLVESPAGGNTTAWTSLLMRSEGNDIWSRTIFSETDIPNYNAFPSAAVEYYFVAANGLGINGESPHRAFDLIACPPATP